MGRAIAAIALVAVLLVGGGVIATTAYQAGLSTAVTTAVTDTGATVVTSPVIPAYGYPGYGYGHGWGGPGFGFFGFLGTIVFLFLIFGLLRAAFGRGRGWGGPGGPGGRGGWGGPGAHGYDRWQGRAKEVFDDFHKDAHASDSASSADTKQPPSA